MQDACCPADRASTLLVALTRHTSTHSLAGCVWWSPRRLRSPICSRRWRSCGQRGRVTSSPYRPRRSTLRAAASHTRRSTPHEAASHSGHSALHGRLALRGFPGCRRIAGRSFPACHPACRPCACRSNTPRRPTDVQRRRRVGDRDAVLSRRADSLRHQWLPHGRRADGAVGARQGGQALARQRPDELPGDDARGDHHRHDPLHAHHLLRSHRHLMCQHP